MKKEVFVFVFAVILLISIGVFAESETSEVSQEISHYVKSFVGKEGINESSVTSITEIDKSHPPKEIDIGAVEENNIGIYEVNYTKDAGQKKIFVVTYSAQEVKKQEEIKNINYLYFGYSGSSESSDYLQTATGVKTGGESGYVMMRSGSITGISTSMLIEGEGNVNIKVFKNGEDTKFGNMISPNDKKKIDYDLQSEEVLNFEPGDVISVYVDAIGNIKWGNVVTMVESTS